MAVAACEVTSIVTGSRTSRWRRWTTPTTRPKRTKTPVAGHGEDHSQCCCSPHHRANRDTSTNSSAKAMGIATLSTTSIYWTAGRLLTVHCCSGYRYCDRCDDLSSNSMYSDICCWIQCPSLSPMRLTCEQPNTK